MPKSITPNYSRYNAVAELIGLNVAPVKLTKLPNKYLPLIERFNRVPKGENWTRKTIFSALRESEFIDLSFF